MKVNSRFCVLSLVAALFVLSMAFVPEETSASKPEHEKARSASTKTPAKSREGVADIESARERADRPTPIGEASSRQKPGGLGRIGEFFKKLFVSRNEEAKGNEEQKIDGEDPDLPAKRFMRNGIDKEEYLRLRDEYIASLRGLDAAHPLNPELRVRALDQMESQQAEIARAAQGSKGQIEPLISFST